MNLFELVEQLFEQYGYLVLLIGPLILLLFQFLLETAH